MSIVIDDLDVFKKTLKKGVDSNTNFAIFSIISGILLMVAGCFFAGIYFFKRPENDFWYSLNNSSVYSTLIITLVIEAGAIILFLIYKGSLKQAEYYRNELIVLRDLTIALQICEATSDKDFNDTESRVQVPFSEKSITRHLTQKSKMQEQIIETLLARCSN